MYRFVLIFMFSCLAFAQVNEPADKGWFAGISAGVSEFSPPDSEPTNCIDRR